MHQKVWRNKIFFYTFFIYFSQQLHFAVHVKKPPDSFVSFLKLYAGSFNVVKDDPSNANILYVGTDHGLYVSLDKGKTFMGMAISFLLIMI